MRAVIETNAWDMLRTPEGHMVLVVPPCARPIAVVADDDGLHLVTAGAVHSLPASAHLADAVGAAASLVVVEADEGVLRETIVRRVDDRRTANLGSMRHDARQRATV